MKKQNKRLFYNNRFVFAACGIAAGIMLIVYACTSVFPFGDNTVLRMDLYHQYGPLFAELYDRIFAGKGLAYSWTSGLGSCFLGNYFNYLSSPIGAIVVFFGHKHVPEAIGAMVLIKAALCAGTFTYYLKRSLRSHSILSASFGVLYAFCAYMLAYYWNVMWLDAMVLLPLILLGIERIIRFGKPGLYFVSLALSMFSNYYMTYMLCLFAVLYFLYDYFAHFRLKSLLPGAVALGKGTLSSSRFWRSGWMFALTSLAAGCLMAAALIPTYLVLQNCSATGSTFPTELKSYFTIFDFFANHYSGLTTTIRSSGDDVLPNVYCGALTILLAPLYFFTKSIKKKEKVASLLLLSFFFLSFSTNDLNFIWHGFHFPNDLPYRFSFMYSFLLLVMAYKTLLRLREFSSRQIAVVGAALIAFLIIVQDIKSKNVTDLTVFASIVYLVLYVLLLTMFKSHRALSASVAVLLCVFICSEAIVCDTQSFPNTVTRASYEDDYDEFRTLKEKLDTIEGNDDYRMELTYLRTRMDNCWFGYNGVSTFSSMTYENLAKLESQLGMMSNRINSFTYNPQTPVYNMIHALKYVVNNTTPNVISNAHYKQVANEGKYTAYRIKETLPLGFLTHSALEYWDTTSSNPFDVQQDFFTLSTNVNDELFSPLSVAYVNYNNTDPFTEDLSGTSFYFQKTDRKADSDASATFTLLAPKNKNIYIFYQVDGASAKDVTINSEEGAYSRNASQNSILDLGAFDEGESINITIPFERENGYCHFYACTLNESVFQKGYAVLSNRTLQVTEQTDTTVAGTFSAAERSILFTSIPYDDGWSVEIDGEPVAPSDIVKIGDALLGVRVEKGNHSIRLHYTVPGMKMGLAISLATAVLLALVLLLFRRRRPTLFNAERVRWSEQLFLPEKKTPAAAPAPLSAQGMPKREVFRPEKTLKREVITPPQPPAAKAPQQTAEMPFDLPQAVVGTFSEQKTPTDEN
ncbi:MAG: YfhO family protein [Clostridia bacterium]|nr:YfhO family protein [Clostridia bacterium]